MTAEQVITERDRVTGELGKRSAAELGKLGLFVDAVEIAAPVEALIRANQALASLTAEQARSSTLTQLRSFNYRVQSESTAVQSKMTLILKALHSPPPQS